MINNTSTNKRKTYINKADNYICIDSHTEEAPNDLLHISEGRIIPYDHYNRLSNKYIGYYKPLTKTLINILLLIVNEKYV